MIIEKYKNITPRQCLDCRIKALQEILRSVDINVTPMEVMILAESPSFQYGNINFSSSNLFGLPYCVSSETDLDEIIFSKLGIKWIEEQIGSSPEDWEHMKSLLDRGIPILFKIDARFLNYKDPEKHMIIDMHYLSHILLVGYKEDMSAVYIVLTNDDTVTEPRELSFEDFEKYRNTKCIPFSPENRCIYIDPAENQNLSVSIEEKLKQSYEQMYHRFEDSVSVPVDIKDFECHELYKGSTGIEMFIDHINTLRKKIKTEKSSSINKYVCVSLLFFKKNMMFGTYSAFRDEFSQCLIEHSSKLNAPLLIKAADCFKKSGDKWKHLFVCISKVPHDLKHSARYLRRISAYLNKILRYEELGFKYIEKGL